MRISGLLNSIYQIYKSEINQLGRASSIIPTMPAKLALSICSHLFSHTHKETMQYSLCTDIPVSRCCSWVRTQVLILQQVLSWQKKLWVGGESSCLSSLWSWTLKSKNKRKRKKTKSQGIIKNIRYAIRCNN